MIKKISPAPKPSTPFISFFFQGGIFFFQLIDHYAASISIMYLSFFELVAISWCFGIGRLKKSIREMTGETPSIYFTFCWCVIAPAFIMVIMPDTFFIVIKGAASRIKILFQSIWIFSLIDYEPPTYANGQYKYPAWAEGLGWSIASLSLACIPSYGIYVFCSAEGDSIVQVIYHMLFIQKCG